MRDVYMPLRDVVWKEIAPGVDRGELRVTAPGAGAALLRFRMGSSVADHVHAAGEELFVFTGKLRIGGRILSAGDYLHTPPHGVNDAEALEDSIAFQLQSEPMRFVRG